MNRLVVNVGDVLEIGGRLYAVAPDKRGGATLEPSALSCPSKRTCTAVWEFTDRGVERPFAEHWNGDKWTIKKLPVPPARSPLR